MIPLINTNEKEIIEDEQIIQHDDFVLKSRLSTPKMQKYCLITWIIISIVFCILWLSETQFSEGILRKKMLNESCKWSFTKILNVCHL